MTVVFRCNAGPSIGFGHLMRCRALAQALSSYGVPSVMVGPALIHKKSLDESLFTAWYPIAEWLSSLEDASLIVDIAKQHNSNFLVLDDYRVDEQYQLRIRDAGVRWLQFDGTAKKALWADIVVNANPAATFEEYSKVIKNPRAKVLLGPKFSILRSEFQAIDPRPFGRPVKKVLVTFGGGDDRGAIEFVLSALVPTADSSLSFIVMCGAHNPNSTQIRKWIRDNGRGCVELRIGLDSVVETFFESDLAVMAGGTSIYEAIRCNLKVILITIAENQVSQSRAWAALGVVNYLGEYGVITSELLRREFDQIMIPTESETITKNAIDGLGAIRVTEAIRSVQC